MSESLRNILIEAADIGNILAEDAESRFDGPFDRPRPGDAEPDSLKLPIRHLVSIQLTDDERKDLKIIARIAIKRAILDNKKEFSRAIVIDNVFNRTDS